MKFASLSFNAAILVKSSTAQNLFSPKRLRALSAEQTTDDLETNTNIPTGSMSIALINGNEEGLASNRPSKSGKEQGLTSAKSSKNGKSGKSETCAPPVVDVPGRPNAAGISYSTIYCQEQVYNNAVDGTYDAIDQPEIIQSTLDLGQYGKTFEGVKVYPLEAGVVTPKWKDDQDQERGEALLWVPDDFTERDGPRLLYVHGGGWNTCSPKSCGYAPFASKLARLYSMPVLAIDYPLVSHGPGNFTSILEQTGMATHFLATNEPLDIANEGMNYKFAGLDDVVNLDEQPMILAAGDSSGGGTVISALVAQESPDLLPYANGARISGGVAFSPWINLEADGPTYFSQLQARNECEGNLVGDLNFGFGTNLTTLIQVSRDGGAAYSQDVNDPIASPLKNAPSDWLESLVPLQLHVGMAEQLQSDSDLFAQRVAKAGGNHIESHTYDGMWHVFQMYGEGCGIKEKVVLAESSLEFSKRFIENVIDTSLGESDKKKACFTPHYEYPTGQDSASGMEC